MPDSVSEQEKPDFWTLRVSSGGHDVRAKVVLEEEPHLARRTIS